MGRGRVLSDEEMESELYASLKPVRPVQPDPEFVQRLKQRLTSEPVVILERRAEAAVFVVLATALFSGAMLAWLIFTLRSILRRAATRAE